MNPEEQQQLLRLARQTIEARLDRRDPPPAFPITTSPAEFGGAFVTLRKAGRLRGCIGRFNPGSDVAETVQQMALAALNDLRFRSTPVTKEELPHIDIEISLLSPMKRTHAPLSLRLGIDGVYIRNGCRSGCFLPQVALEQGWDKEEFLSRCCGGKAGLPPDAWRDPATEVYLFSAEVFGEKQSDRPDGRKGGSQPC